MNTRANLESTFLCIDCRVDSSAGGCWCTVCASLGDFRQVEDVKFLISSSCRKKGTRFRGKCDSSNNMRMLNCVESFAGVCVPNLPVLDISEMKVVRDHFTYAVKSAEAVAAYLASGESL